MEGPCHPAPSRGDRSISLSCDDEQSGALRSGDSFSPKCLRSQRDTYSPSRAFWVMAGRCKTPLAALRRGQRVGGLVLGRQGYNAGHTFPSEGHRLL